MELDVLDAIELIKKAYVEEEKEKLWQLYLTKYQYMNQETYIAFEDFINPSKVIDRTYENKTFEEIVSEAESILDSLRTR